MTADTASALAPLDEILPGSSAVEAYRELHEKLADHPVPDPVVIELCRLRSAMLMDVPAELERRSPTAIAAGLGEETVRALPQWPTSTHFDGRVRAALSFTEAFLFGGEQARDEVGLLRSEFSDEEVFALGVCVAFHEAHHLLCHAITQLRQPPSQEPDHDQ